MSNQFSRTELLIGKDAVEKLHKSKVAIFGIGGVGSFVVEGLVRAGIENFILVDNDLVSESNLNRQLIATKKTIGKYKVDIMKERINDINPNAKVEVFKVFYTKQTQEKILDETVDYVVDAIDSVSSKIELIVNAQKNNIPIISSMGTGNKLDPTRFEITDIYKTEVCPLAKVIRKELKSRNVEKLKVLYSKEEPIKVKPVEENNTLKHVPASISFVPSVAGLIISGEVIKDLTH